MTRPPRLPIASISFVLRRDPVAVIRQLRDPVKGRRPPRHQQQPAIVHREAIEAHRPAAAGVEHVGQRVAQFADVVGHAEHEAADAGHAHARERQRILAVDSGMRFGVRDLLVLRWRRRAQLGAGFGKRRRRVFRHFRPRRIEKRFLAEALRRELDDQVRRGVRARPLQPRDRDGRFAIDGVGRAQGFELEILEHEIEHEQITRAAHRHAEFDRQPRPQRVEDTAEIGERRNLPETGCRACRRHGGRLEGTALCFLRGCQHGGLLRGSGFLRGLERRWSGPAPPAVSSPALRSFSARQHRHCPRTFCLWSCSLPADGPRLQDVHPSPARCSPDGAVRRARIILPARRPRQPR